MKLIIWLVVLLDAQLDATGLQPAASPFACTGLYVSSAKVADHEVVALVDTGCEACFIDKKFFDQHLASTVTQIGTTSIVLGGGRIVVAPKFVAPVQLSSCRQLEVLSSLVEQQQLSKTIGYDLTVVIGMSYLAQYPMRFNGALGSVEQLAVDAALPMSPALHLRTRSNRPVVPITLPLIGVRDFLIDTGMNRAIALEANRLEQLERGGFAVRLPEPPRRISDGDGNVHEEFTYWLRRIEINGRRFENLLATTAKEAIIGMELLRHFDMTIDCPGKRLWMEALPGSDDASFAPGGTGFNFRFDPQHRLLVLENMRSGGPSELAGIKPGDEVVAIDGTSVHGWSYYAVTDRFSQAGTNLRLKCRRNGENFEVEFTLKHRVQYPPDWPPEREEFNPDAAPETKPESEKP